MITAIMMATVLIAPMQDVPTAKKQSATSQPATPEQIVASLSIPEILSDAEELLKQGNVAIALEAYRKIIQRDPTNIDATLGLAAVAEAQNDFNTARTLFLKAREIDKTDFRVNYRLGTAYLRINFYQQALRFLEFAEPMAPPDKVADLKIRLAVAYRGTGARTKAKEYAKQAVKLDPDNYAAQEILAVARLEDGEFEPARANIDNMVRIARGRLSDDASDPENIKFLLGALDRQSQALNMYHISLYQKDATGKPTDRLFPGQEIAAASSLLPVIEIELQKGELQKVLRMHAVIPLALRAVKYDPNNASAWMTLGLLYLNTSQTQSAIESFQKVVALRPDDVRAAEQLKLLHAPLTSRPAEETPDAAAPAVPAKPVEP